MKAFITGGTGFIGSHLINYLMNHKDINIYALVRDLNNLKWLKGLNIHFLKGDIFSIPSLPEDIDYVFHIAGSTKSNKSADYYTVNQQGTASLFQSLDSQKIYPKKIIYLSSLAAVGPSSEERPIKENDLPHPVTPYGKSKLLGEPEALKFIDKFSIVILRVGPVFGPRDEDFLSFFRFIKKGILPHIGSKQSLYSLCYVKDLIKVMDLCTKKDLKSGEIINIANPKPYSWDELGKVAGQAMGKTLKRVNFPLPIVYLIVLISELRSKITKKPSALNRHKYKEMKERFWIADVKKAQEKLSFSPQFTLQEAIQETTDWYFKHGWL